MPRTQRSHPPSSTSPQGPGGSSASPLAPTAPGILLNQHGHRNRGSAAVVQPGGWRGGAANPRLAPLGTVLSALSLVSNIDSSPEGLIHLQVSAYILHVFIFIRHLVSLKSKDQLPSKGMSPDEILSVEQSKFSPKHPPITYNILPPPSHLCQRANWRTTIEEAVPTLRLYRAKPQPKLSSMSSWYPTSKNTHAWAILKGCSGKKGLLYQLQSDPASLH